MVKIEFLSAEIPIINIYKHILDPEELFPQFSYTRTENDPDFQTAIKASNSFRLLV